jgi:hypothetical protein
LQALLLSEFLNKLRMGAMEVVRCEFSLCLVNGRAALLHHHAQYRRVNGGDSKSVGQGLEYAASGIVENVEVGENE